jgi:hypothetical protein
MTNRTGKREREARSRRKRGWSYRASGVRTGTSLQALKLGSKKRAAMSASTRFGALNWHVLGALDMPAVPVAEAERQGKSDEELETYRSR